MAQSNKIDSTNREEASEELNSKTELYKVQLLEQILAELKK